MIDWSACGLPKYGEWSDYDCVLGSDFCGDATAAWLPHALHFYSKIGLC